jgi:hypothetical protein
VAAARCIFTTVPFADVRVTVMTNEAGVTLEPDRARPHPGHAGDERFEGLRIADGQQVVVRAWRWTNHCRLECATGGSVPR